MELITKVTYTEENIATEHSMAKNPSHSLSRGIEIGATKRPCFETALHSRVDFSVPSRLHNSIICLKACLMREDIFNSDDGVLEYIHKENC